MKLKDLEEESWFFGEIPTSITTAILRDQVPGCFILRSNGLGTKTILSFRMDRTVKHIEVLLDEATQKYRVKDESDAVCYANFLQFDSIQQLLDQCKQHPTLGITLEKYPTIKNADEIWRVDWADIENGGENDSDLPWNVSYGKFHSKDALIHVLPEGSSDILKEKFSNQSRLMMTLNHDNVVRLEGVGIKGPRSFMVQGNLPNGDLSDYLTRNSSLLLSYPTELGHIMNQVINGMVYLHECSVVHGELIPKNCLVGDKGMIKISGFHCARSPWCKGALSDDVYKNKIPIPAPELSESSGSFPSDVWAYGLFIYAVTTAIQEPITDLEQVLKLKRKDDVLDNVSSFIDKIAMCLQAEPKARPTFQNLRDSLSEKAGSSTPSCSSHSLEDPLNVQNFADENSKLVVKKNKDTMVESFVDGSAAMDWDDTDIPISYDQEKLKQRLRSAELEALKAKALQKRAEAAKDSILAQVQEAETKCLKEVELMTKTFLVRLNEANDRAVEAEQARYIAEEVKRLTEEKYTLYKYESEKNMHELRSMFDDALLERDELVSALKSVSKDFDAPELISPKRKDSINQLEEKYQRYISTSDRTIQSLKTQLNGVVKQRDELAIHHETARNEMRDTREALDQAEKEKEEFQFRLEEAQFEIERLEEMISTMTQKRQQAERERDQLQMLTDMSLMKLRQAESEAPRKRASLCSFPPKMEDRPKDKRDPSLRRLSEQLLHLIDLPSGEAAGERSDIQETDRNIRTSGVAIENVSPHGKQKLRRLGKSAMPSIPQIKKFAPLKPIQRKQNDCHQYASDGHNSTSAVNNVCINENENPQKDTWQEAMNVCEEPEKKTLPEDQTTFSDCVSTRHFTIPTLHIEEADTDSDMDHVKEVPQIAISEFDNTDLAINEVDDDEECSSYETEGQDSPMFIVGDHEGQTRIVYSVEDLPKLLEGIPQTSL